MSSAAITGIVIVTILPAASPTSGGSSRSLNVITIGGPADTLGGVAAPVTMIELAGPLSEMNGGRGSVNVASTQPASVALEHCT